MNDFGEEIDEEYYDNLRCFRYLLEDLFNQKEDEDLLESELVEQEKNTHLKNFIAIEFNELFQS